MSQLTLSRGESPLPAPAPLFAAEELSKEPQTVPYKISTPPHHLHPPASWQCADNVSNVLLQEETKVTIPPHQETVINFPFPSILVVLKLWHCYSSSLGQFGIPSMENIYLHVLMSKSRPRVLPGLRTALHLAAWRTLKVSKRQMNNGNTEYSVDQAPNLLSETPKM